MCGPDEGDGSGYAGCTVDACGYAQLMDSPAPSTKITEQEKVLTILPPKNQPVLFC